MPRIGWSGFIFPLRNSLVTRRPRVSVYDQLEQIDTGELFLYTRLGSGGVSSTSSSSNKVVVLIIVVVVVVVIIIIEMVVVVVIV